MIDPSLIPIFLIAMIAIFYILIDRSEWLKNLTVYILETMMIILALIGFITILVMYLTVNPISEITGNLIKELQTAEDIAEAIGAFSVLLFVSWIIFKTNKTWPDLKMDVGAAITIFMGVLWLTL